MNIHNHSARVLWPMLMLLITACVMGCDRGRDREEFPAPAEGGLVQNPSRSVVYTLMAMNEDASDKEMLEFIGSMIPDPQAQDASPFKKSKDLLDDFFRCGELTLNRRGIEYSFDHQSSCPGLSGSIQAHFGNMNPGQDMEVWFNGLSAGDCTVEGLVTIGMTRQDSLVSAVLNSNDLSICDREFSGTAIISIQQVGDTFLLNMDRSRVYESGDAVATVSSRFAWDLQEGVNGFAEVEYDGEIYSLTATGVHIDRTCGLPNEGTLMVSGSDGNTAEIDFNRTSCENKVAAFTWNGLNMTVDLEEAAEHYRNIQSFNINRFLTAVE